MATRRMILSGLLATAACSGALQAAEQATVGRFMMENGHGETVTDEMLIGRFSLVAFGYTHCPDVCPTTMFTLSKVLKGLGADGDKLLAIFVSVDPDRDTTQVLADYAANFDARLITLRGPKPYTDAIVKAFGAAYEIQPSKSDPDNYSVDHTASIALVAPDGTLLKRYAYKTPADTIAADLKKLLAAAPVGASQQ